MDLHEAKNEYAQALKKGQREVKEYVAAGKSPYPVVLDEILDSASLMVLDMGVVEIPTSRIVGTKTPGRAVSFSPSFYPILEPTSEFAAKWASLCAAHLEEGIRDSILCFEYLGNFYVQEGNKRLSVLRHFGAPRIASQVKRIMPAASDEPLIQAYYEFVEFYKASRSYIVQFRRPGDYARLLTFMNKEPGQEWQEQERRTFAAYFHYFEEAFRALCSAPGDTLPEEALLLWLQVHPYEDLGALSSAQLKKSLEDLWPDVVTSSQPTQVQVDTEPVPETKQGLLSRIISLAPERIQVAFVHQLDIQTSTWALGHEQGRKYLEEKLGDKVVTRSYFGANTTAQAEAILEQAVAEGAQMVFTTAPRLTRATLKMAVKHPKVRFLNYSVDEPYSSVRTYYGRIFEAKFVTGAIAGTMAENNRIGYIGSNPIFGVPASINAFALGAQMTNPRAVIDLRWSCCPGNPQADLLRDGVRVVSNRDVPAADKMYLEFCNYGTYRMDDRGAMVPLASPVWMWGKFYEFAVNAVLTGAWKEDKQNPKAVNYWLGMDSGVIDVEMSDRLPAGIRSLAQQLRQGMIAKTVDPFFREIIAQDGTVKNDGTRRFAPEELLKMDWLCENVHGSIPSFEELLPQSQPLVRKLGIYRDRIPLEKEDGQ